MLERAPDLRADIVITGLPAESEPLCDALLDTVQPELIIIADSEYPATQRASPRLRDRLAQKGIPVIYTCTAGAVTISVNPDGWELKTMDGQQLRARNHAGRGQLSKAGPRDRVQTTPGSFSAENISCPERAPVLQCASHHIE